jgi:hypothetical protein
VPLDLALRYTEAEFYLLRVHQGGFGGRSGTHCKKDRTRQYGSESVDYHHKDAWNEGQGLPL